MRVKLLNSLFRFNFVFFIVLVMYLALFFFFFFHFVSVFLFLFCYVFLLSWVERCSSIAELMGLIPVQAGIFTGFFFSTA